ncbi:GxxExxY protein [Asticcacaulis sp. AND118]|uniref:GxxExxY protein n=1 Tax=Asticcacaulis sp. AND118 TaxID=2840468 RepID=UPI001CFFE2BB|nr:GxxExxY protein [Asticcacaulis sp. AND118]UDF03615.1 GxxExxY protein [Asticcacaulis sp. AND118]
MTDILFKNESYAIQGAIFEVNKEMGAGFLEAVYQECLTHEFRIRGIPHVAQKSLNLSYKGFALDQIYLADFVCYDSIIIELKVTQSLADIHRAQLMNYLKATGLKLGLLVNFGTHPKAQIERIVL